LAVSQYWPLGQRPEAGSLGAAKPDAEPTRPRASAATALKCMIGIEETWQCPRWPGCELVDSQLWAQKGLISLGTKSWIVPELFENYPKIQTRDQRHR
jgi:hypothetical protein